MIRRLNHIGVSVSNLTRSIHFYRDLLGMNTVFDGRFGDPGYATIMNLKGAKGKVALLEAGGLQLELYEFESPMARPGDPERPVCDHGITHFCVEVIDIEAEYRRLRAAGIDFHCPPLEFTGTGKATYGRDPDGNVFELVQMNDRSGF